VLEPSARNRSHRAAAQHNRYKVVMVRTQILLTEEQARDLHKLAAAEARSMADLVRDGVGAMLASRAGGTRDHARARALAAVGRFRSGAPDLGTRHDDHLAEVWKS
jgi:hypothetical protein